MSDYSDQHILPPWDEKSGPSHIKADSTAVILRLQDAIDKALADYGRGRCVHEIMRELKAAQTSTPGEPPA